MLLDNPVKLVIQITQPLQQEIMKHIKLNTISLKTNPRFNEKWLHEIIANDPSILGIGDVITKEKERRHTGGGRLDLLLQDSDGHGRYEVEIQLGETDPSHIIRVIEYWDIERRRYPQYDHTAVLIAENITSRFLNVISLFNGFIPLMAIQVSAIETHDRDGDGDGVGLHFTKILDTIELGYEEEESEQTDRNYWENGRGTKKTVALADSILKMAKGFISSVEFSYNKYYMGFWVEDRACNFALCRPQRNALRLEIRLPQTEETDTLISDSQLDFLEYDRRGGSYRLTLKDEDISEKSEALKNLLKQAYDLRK